MNHPGETIWEYALGTLSVDEADQVGQHVAACAPCAAELRSAEEAVATVSLDLPPLPPGPAVLERLLQSTEGRFEGLIDKLMRFWDLGADRARELLADMTTRPWQPSGIPGVDLQHLTAGPRVAHLDAGFVRFAPGTPFPQHRHVGDEIQLILEGSLVEDSGMTFRVGDSMVRPVGSCHSFRVGPEGCILALLLDGGIVIDGVKYGVSS